MADENTNQEVIADAAAPAGKWTAKLVSGNVYVYGTKFFFKDVESDPIDDEMKKALEVDAVDPATIQVGETITVENRPKFVFTPVAVTRTRSRG